MRQYLHDRMGLEEAIALAFTLLMVAVSLGVHP